MNSFLDSFFKLKENNTNVKTEIVAEKKYQSPKFMKPKILKLN